MQAFPWDQGEGGTTSFGSQALQHSGLSKAQTSCSCMGLSRWSCWQPCPCPHPQPGLAGPFLSPFRTEILLKVNPAGRLALWDAHTGVMESQSWGEAAGLAWWGLAGGHRGSKVQRLEMKPCQKVVLWKVVSYVSAKLPSLARNAKKPSRHSPGQPAWGDPARAGGWKR